MRLVDSIDGASYLRCWGDYYRYSLVVRPGDEPSLANMAWRTSSEEALATAAANVEANGVQGEWVDGGHAHGKAYQFTGPYGHPMKLFYEVEKYAAEPGFESAYPDRPERRSSHAAAPRFLDHVTIAASDVRGFADWYNRTLGFRVMAFTNPGRSTDHGLLRADHQREVPRPRRRHGHFGSRRAREPYCVLGGHP